MTTTPGPEVPPDLVRAIGAGQCVAFVGAGFSAAALPGWVEWATLFRKIERVFVPADSQ